ncbi:LysR family transcriptional regulator [Pseudomonas sp. NPDC090202]|uniref:LysR family transcriptional regulator n=1 Tax=unclassified Pseudomonas TaxID=196821 RepID=UPI00381A25B3
MMNLMHWRLMVAVADAQSVTRAAEGYGITQSGASQAISQMEDALGVKLFVRDRRTTTLTAIGQQVVAHARRMLDELDCIQRLTRDSRDVQRGTLRLACFPSVFAELLPAQLNAFARLYPGIEVVVVQGTDEEVEHWLEVGSVDVGVVMNPAADRDVVPLGQDRWVAVAGRQQRIAGSGDGGQIALAEIVDQPFIVATGGCYLHGQTLVRDAGMRLSDVRMTVSDWASAYRLIEQGQGMAIVPESTLPADRSRLQVLMLAPPVYRTFALARSRQAESSPAVDALLEVVRQSLDPGDGAPAFARDAAQPA